MINLKATFNTGLELARFFFRSPQDQAVENATASGLKLVLKIAALPELQEFEDDFEILLKAYGWDVQRSAATKHITAVKPPDGQWVMTQGGHYEWRPA